MAQCLIYGSYINTTTLSSHKDNNANDVRSNVQLKVRLVILTSVT